MLSDNNKVSSVVIAYRSVAIETARAAPFLSVKLPPLESKTYANCVQFYDSAEEFGVSVHALMLICLDSYSPWWCMKVFKRKYPSLQLTVSEKTRNRALKNFPKVIVNSQQDELAQFYVSQLKNYNHMVAEGLVRNGLCGEDADMQALVLRKLSEERAA